MDHCLNCRRWCSAIPLFLILYNFIQRSSTVLLNRNKKLQCFIAMIDLRWRFSLKKIKMVIFRFLFLSRWFERWSGRKRYCQKLWTSGSTLEFLAKFRAIGQPKAVAKSAASADIFNKAGTRSWSTRCRKFWHQTFWKFPALNRKTSMRSFCSSGVILC